MRDEQQTRLRARFVREVAVVQSCDHGLARACGSEEHLVFEALVEAVDELLDRLGLIAGGLERRDELEVGEFLDERLKGNRAVVGLEGLRGPRGAVAAHRQTTGRGWPVMPVTRGSQS